MQCSTAVVMYTDLHTGTTFKVCTVQHGYYNQPPLSRPLVIRFPFNLARNCYEQQCIVQCA